MTSGSSSVWMILEEARQNIVEYGYTLGDKVADVDIIMDNSRPILDWIQSRKASIADVRSRETDANKRSAILPESLFLLELTETLIIIASNYAKQIIESEALKRRDSKPLKQHNENQSIHFEMAYGL